MAKYVNLMVKNKKITESLNGFFSRLFKEKIIDALLVPQRLSSNVVQTLISNPEKLEFLDPLAPVMPVNSSVLVSDLTKSGRTPESPKIGVILKPCEIRALIELVKLNQASLDSLLIIGVDCFGTYSIPDYGEFLKGVDKKMPSGDKFLQLTTSSKQLTTVRPACQVCEHPTPENTGISILLMGTDYTKEIIIEVEDSLAESISKIGLKEAKTPLKREAAISKLKKEREKKREKLFTEKKTEISKIESLISLFSTCIGCQNCRRVCPICYCDICLFETDVLKYDSTKFLRWADKKGILRMPTDTLLFHITRMNHMITSCVGCGMCESVCPSNIPVGTIFTMLGGKVQKVFDYTPGRSVEDELPLATFREEELEPR